MAGIDIDHYIILLSMYRDSADGITPDSPIVVDRWRCSAVGPKAHSYRYIHRGWPDPIFKIVQ